VPREKRKEIKEHKEQVCHRSSVDKNGFVLFSNTELIPEKIKSESG
jgi:predicted nucleic acid-binding protein